MLVRRLGCPLKASLRAVRLNACQVSVAAAHHCLGAATCTGGSAHHNYIDLWHRPCAAELPRPSEACPREPRLSFRSAMSSGTVGDHAVPVASALLNLSTSMQCLEGPRGKEYEALTAPVLQALQQVHTMAVKAWSALSKASTSARADVTSMLTYAEEVRTLLVVGSERGGSALSACVAALDSVTAALSGALDCVTPQPSPPPPASADTPPVEEGTGTATSVPQVQPSTWVPPSASAAWNAPNPAAGWHAPAPAAGSSMADLLRSGAAARARTLRAGRDSVASAMGPLQSSALTRMGRSEPDMRRASVAPTGGPTLRRRRGTPAAAAAESLTAALHQRTTDSTVATGGGSFGAPSPRQGSMPRGSFSFGGQGEEEWMGGVDPPRPRSNSRSSAPPTTLATMLQSGAAAAAGQARGGAAHRASLAIPHVPGGDGATWSRPAWGGGVPPPLDEVPEERERSGSTVSRSGAPPPPAPVQRGLLGEAPPPPPAPASAGVGPGVTSTTPFTRVGGEDEVPPLSWTAPRPRANSRGLRSSLASAGTVSTRNSAASWASGVPGWGSPPPVDSEGRPRFDSAMSGGMDQAPPSGGTGLGMAGGFGLGLGLGGGVWGDSLGLTTLSAAPAEEESP